MISREKHRAELARFDMLTEALRAADAALGNEPPEAQAFAIIAALKALRGDPAKIMVTGSRDRVDYVERVQRAARAAWHEIHGPHDSGTDKDAVAGVDTPIGRLKLVTWRRPWTGNRHGARVAWAGEYYLNDEPITVATMRRAGLAMRPTTRKRQRGT